MTCTSAEAYYQVYFCSSLKLSWIPWACMYACMVMRCLLPTLKTMVAVCCRVRDVDSTLPHSHVRALSLTRCMP